MLMMRLLTYLLLALTAASATAVDVPWLDREVWPQSPQARQMMGHPDEWFPFKGEESGFEDYVKAFRCITQYDALTIAGVDSVNRIGFT